MGVEEHFVPKAVWPNPSMNLNVEEHFVSIKRPNRSWYTIRLKWTPKRGNVSPIHCSVVVWNILERSERYHFQRQSYKPHLLQRMKQYFWRRTTNSDWKYHLNQETQDKPPPELWASVSPGAVLDKASFEWMHCFQKLEVRPSCKLSSCLRRIHEKYVHHVWKGIRCKQSTSISICSEDDWVEVELWTIRINASTIESCVVVQRGRNNRHVARTWNMHRPSRKGGVR
jgi:hypothetical protein